MSQSASVEEYIAGFDVPTKKILQIIRRTINEAAPNAVEDMSYGMPTFRLNGKSIIYFAGFSKHIGVYATPNGHKEFEAELSKYKRGKGSVQFPLDEPMPLELIKRMTLYRVSALTKGAI
jgi:uncharacterized protein YdhG (YjbR/CyaY superfamily)